MSHTAPTPPSTSAPVPPVENEATRGADSTHHEEAEITFDKKEAADSILSEEHESDDEVFSSQTGSKVPAPVVPAPDPEVPGAPHPLGASASKIPTLELRTPVEIIPAPISASTLLPPPSPPEQGTASIPAPSTPINPFAFGPSGPPLPAQQMPVRTDQATTGKEALSGDASDAQPRKQIATDRPSRPLLYVLISYAAIMTLLAIYALFFRKADTLDPGHPLSTIPDNFGEFDPAVRKKVSQLKLDLDAPLPANQQVVLGERLQIGQIEIEPIAVEKRPLTIIREGRTAGDTQRRTTRLDALVLRIRVKNTSADLPIFPLDPAFTRSAKMDDRPAMRLAIGRHMLYGGAISWPFGDRVKREYEEAQALDDQPLQPGETREYVVFTNEDAGLAQVVKKATEPLVWRIQIRRGVVEFRGKEVPVSAIIGIEFKASDVRNLG